MTIEPPMHHVHDRALAIAELLGTYRHLTVDDAFRSKGLVKLATSIQQAVDRDDPVQIVLPAFAFKSPNQSKKTLGVLPDKAEEIALGHLQGLAENVARIYDKGAQITVVSDGLVYNDLLGVSDETVFEYGQALRAMAKRIGASKVRFARISKLLGHSDYDTKESYAAHVDSIRHALLTQYTRPGDREGIERDLGQDGTTSDVKRTFTAYKSVLEIDLENVDDAHREGVNLAMLKRGKCFAALIADKIPSHVRLSIHPSDNVDKLSIPLVVSTTYASDRAQPVTIVNPWHGCIVLHADGSWKMTHRGAVDESSFDLSLKDGQPWLLREKAEVFAWRGMDLTFEPMYPCGMLVTPTKNDEPRFEEVEMDKVRALALGSAPLLLRGFAMEVEKDVFRSKAKQLGQVVMWPFGDVLEVRENAELNMNNVLTNEAMPFHYDGVFVTVKGKDGKPKSNPPLFQMFRNKSSNMKGGLTLFSSSRNIIPLLNQGDFDLGKLRNVEWETFTPSNDAFGGDELRLPLFVNHPVSGQLTFRFHEPWPQSKTANCQPTLVKLAGYSEQKSEAVCAKLTEVLYDRRTCYYHAWKAGDFIFNDNMTTHHTRTAFGGGSREHWRVHVN